MSDDEEDIRDREAARKEYEALISPAPSQRYQGEFMYEVLKEGIISFSGNGPLKLLSSHYSIEGKSKTRQQINEDEDEDEDDQNFLIDLYESEDASQESSSDDSDNDIENEVDADLLPPSNKKISLSSSDIETTTTTGGTAAAAAIICDDNDNNNERTSTDILTSTLSSAANISDKNNTQVTSEMQNEASGELSTGVLENVSPLHAKETHTKASDEAQKDTGVISTLSEKDNGRMVDRNGSIFVDISDNEEDNEVVELSNGAIPEISFLEPVQNTIAVQSIDAYYNEFIQVEYGPLQILPFDTGASFNSFDGYSDESNNTNTNEIIEITKGTNPEETEAQQPSTQPPPTVVAAESDPFDEESATNDTDSESMGILPVASFTRIDQDYHDYHNVSSDSSDNDEHDNVDNDEIIAITDEGDPNQSVSISTKLSILGNIKSIMVTRNDSGVNMSVINGRKRGRKRKALAAQNFNTTIDFINGSNEHADANNQMEDHSSQNDTHKKSRRPGRPKKYLTENHQELHVNGSSDPLALSQTQNNNTVDNSSLNNIEPVSKHTKTGHKKQPGSEASTPAKTNNKTNKKHKDGKKKEHNNNKEDKRDDTKKTNKSKHKKSTDVANSGNKGVLGSLSPLTPEEEEEEGRGGRERGEGDHPSDIEVPSDVEFNPYDKILNMDGNEGTFDNSFNSSIDLDQGENENSHDLDNIDLLVNTNILNDTSDNSMDLDDDEKENAINNRSPIKQRYTIGNKTLMNRKNRNKLTNENTMELLDEATESAPSPSLDYEFNTNESIIEKENSIEEIRVDHNEIKDITNILGPLSPLSLSDISPFSDLDESEEKELPSENENEKEIENKESDEYKTVDMEEREEGEKEYFDDDEDYDIIFYGDDDDDNDNEDDDDEDYNVEEEEEEEEEDEEEDEEEERKKKKKTKKNASNNNDVIINNNNNNNNVIINNNSSSTQDKNNTIINNNNIIINNNNSSTQDKNNSSKQDGPSDNNMLIENNTNRVDGMTEISDIVIGKNLSNARSETSIDNSNITTITSIITNNDHIPNDENRDTIKIVQSSVPVSKDLNNDNGTNEATATLSPPHTVSPVGGEPGALTSKTEIITSPEETNVQPGQASDTSTVLTNNSEDNAKTTKIDKTNSPSLPPSNKTPISNDDFAVVTNDTVDDTNTAQQSTLIDQKLDDRNESIAKTNETVTTSSPPPSVASILDDNSAVENVSNETIDHTKPAEPSSTTNQNSSRSIPPIASLIISDQGSSDDEQDPSSENYLGKNERDVDMAETSGDDANKNVHNDDSAVSIDNNDNNTITTDGTVNTNNVVNNENSLQSSTPVNKNLDNNNNNETNSKTNDITTSNHSSQSITEDIPDDSVTRTRNETGTTKQKTPTSQGSNRSIVPITSLIISDQDDYASDDSFFFTEGENEDNTTNTMDKASPKKSKENTDNSPSSPIDIDFYIRSFINNGDPFASFGDTDNSSTMNVEAPKENVSFSDNTTKNKETGIINKTSSTNENTPSGTSTTSCESKNNTVNIEEVNKSTNNNNPKSPSSSSSSSNDGGTIEEPTSTLNSSIYKNPHNNINDIITNLIYFDYDEDSDEEEKDDTMEVEKEPTSKGTPSSINETYNYKQK